MFTEPTTLAPVEYSQHSGDYSFDPAVFNQVVGMYPPHLVDGLVLAVQERTGIYEGEETYYRLVVVLSWFITEEHKQIAEIAKEY